jgi:subtilisin-like proprotein convertase family protein
MKKALLSLLLLIFISSLSFSQVPWSTVKPPIGRYVKLPNNITPWTNPNTQTMVYYTPAGVMSVGPNVRVLPNSSEQDELYLSYNPQVPNVMFGSANTTVGSSYGQGVYVTTNAGVTWYGTDLMPNEPSSTSDPAPAIDKNGIFVFTSLNTVNSSNAFMYGQYSTNYGVNWSTPYTIYSGSSDKNLSASDDVPSSPYYGRTYTAWTVWSGSYPIGVSYTTNSGVTWSTYQAINSPSTTSQGADVVVGPAGVVYVCWSRQSGVSTGVGFSKSTNGGVTWTTTEAAYTSNGIRDNSNFGGWGVRVNDFPRIAVDKSGGARNGWIYIVDAQKNLSPAGSDADIILHKSTDGGTTWSSGVRVNQDPINNGKLQFFPVVCVDGSGGVNVLYYDNRNYASSADSCETYMSRSIDGGVTFSDIKVSDHRWKPVGEGGSGTYMGDYIGLAFCAGKLWPFWFDNKTGHMQAWTAPIDIGPSMTHTPLGNTELISGNRVVNCTITPAGSPINPSTVKLYYSLNNPTLTSNVTMTNSSGDNWTANLPLSGAGLYRYYLTATDNLSRTVTYPGGAPAVTVQFIAAADTVQPVIVHTPITNTPKSTWPVSVSANVTDNIGIDSVWVRWYKNNTGLGVKLFKLPNTTGSTYSALFNSINSDVAIGDSIFYRVIAQDNSSGHNRDSTALIKFTITNVVATNVCITKWIPIRDNVSTYDSVQVGTHSNIIKVNFTMVNLIHTYDGDVTFALRSPNGTEVVLTSGNGGSGDNYINTVFNDSATTPIASGTAPFTGTFTPTSPLSAFNGQDAYGWWRFRVSDGAGGDTGHVGQYCIQIYSGGTLTGLSNIGILPTKFELSQNYPNPFNPTTKINFAIPKQGLVTMKIYDVLGREVRTLINEIKPAGNYTVDFNASELSSGVYFYRVQSGDFSDIKRMILIK